MKRCIFAGILFILSAGPLCPSLAAGEVAATAPVQVPRLSDRPDNVREQGRPLETGQSAVVPSEPFPVLPGDAGLFPEAASLRDALAHYSQGSIFEQAGQESKALEHYQRTLDLDPTNFRLANTVALLMERRGEIPRALNVLKDSIAANPKEASAYRMIAFLYLTHQEKPELALEYARKAVEVAPEDFETYRVLYDVHIYEDQIAEAYEVLQEAAGRKSSDAEYWLSLGQTYWSHIVEYVQEGYEKEQARLNRIFKKAERLAKNDTGVLDQVATYYINSDQRENAIELYRHILEINSEDTDVRDKLTDALIEEARVDEAVEIMVETARLNPFRYDVQERLGELYLSRARAASRKYDWDAYESDLAKALTYFRSCIDLRPHDPAMFERVIELHLLLDQFKDAFELIDLAQSKFPNVPERPLFGYIEAQALSADRQFERALEVYAAVEPEMTEFNTEYQARFYYDYGAATEQSGDIEGAAELLGKSIRLNPELAPAYNYLGYMWIDKNMMLDEGGQLVERALEMDPENAAYLDSMGWYHFRKGNYGEAFDYLAYSLVIYVNQNLGDSAWEIDDHMGDVYEKFAERLRMSSLAIDEVFQALAISHWSKALVYSPEYYMPRVLPKLPTLADR